MGMGKKLTSEDIAKINELLKNGLKDGEIAKKVGCCTRTIYTYRKSGEVWDLPRRKGGREAGMIDIKTIKMPPLLDGQRIDGTPDLSYSPAFDNDASKIPFTEPYEGTEESHEMEPKNQNEPMKEMSVSVGIHGNHVWSVFDTSGKDLELHFDGPHMEYGSLKSASFEAYFSEIDSIIGELNAIKHFIQSKFA